MPIRLDDHLMSVKVHGPVVAVARLSRQTATGGHGVWIIACLLARLVAPKQVTMALTGGGLQSGGYAADDLRQSTLRQERR